MAVLPVVLKLTTNPPVGAAVSRVMIKVPTVPPSRGLVPGAMVILGMDAISTQQFSFQKVTIYTDRKRDLTGGKIAIANQCWTGVISAIQSL